MSHSNYYRLAIIASDEARAALSTAFLVDSDYIKQALAGARCVTLQQFVDVNHDGSYRRYNLSLEFYNPDRVRTGQDFIDDGADATLFALAMSETETSSAVSAVDDCTPHCLPAEQRLGIRVKPAKDEKQIACFEFITPDNQIHFDAATLNTDAFLKDLIEKLNSMRLDNEAQAAAYHALETGNGGSAQEPEISLVIAPPIGALARLFRTAPAPATHSETSCHPLNRNS